LSPKFCSNDSEETTLSLKEEVKKLQNELRDRREANASLEREINDMEDEIGRLEDEKSKALTRSRTLENELRITRAQVDELLSTNLDNENVIRMKVYIDCETSNDRTPKLPCFKRASNNESRRSRA
jgi:chromosome segregation ATPase